MSKAKYTVKQTITIIQEFQKGEITRQVFARTRGLSPQTIVSIERLNGFKANICHK